MIHHLVAVSALTTFIGAAGTLPASAADLPTIVGRGGDQHGNGRHNRNVVSALSPVHNRGYQHTSNGNAGGTSSAQNGLCRHVTVCDVSQEVSVNITQPERPAPPTGPPAPAAPPASPAAAPPASPAAAPNPPIEVLPQTVVPHNRTVRRPAPRGPFMHMRPDRFTLMAPAPSAGFNISDGTGPAQLGFFG